MADALALLGTLLLGLVGLGSVRLCASLLPGDRRER